MDQRMGRRLLLAVVGWAACAVAPPAWANERSLVEVVLNGRRVEGTPLNWSAAQVLLLGRDGALWDFRPDQVSDYRRRTDAFRSLPIADLRATLLRELGEGYEVSGTRHYVVAHPRGQQDRWPDRFEDLYRSLVHYFLVRGFQVAEPEFPLIGVVCRSRQEFVRQSVEHGTNVASGVLGYYSPKTNRIMLYDMGGGHGTADDWRHTASVVIHESTHQTAFNTGLHNRYCPPPLWLAEGLATLFEAPGVYDSQHYLRQADRINRGRFNDFRRHVAPQHRPDTITQIVREDGRFRSDPGPAYAEAWALTFFLVETRPRQYADYLKRTARRRSFTVYSAGERLADFETCFGKDRLMLEAQFTRFMKGL